MVRPLKGHVHKIASGWAVEVRNKRVGVLPTKQAAREFASAVIAQLKAIDSAPMTLARFADAWFLERQTSGVVGVHKERNRWDKHVKPYKIAHRPIAKITANHVHTWVMGLTAVEATHPTKGSLGRTLSRQTIKHSLKLVQLAFDSAIVQGHCDDNPAARVRVPRMRTRVDDGDVSDQLVPCLTQEEIDRLLEITPPGPRAWFAVAIYCGLRKGELSGLRWSDVVLRGRDPHLRVRRSYRNPNKSSTSRRDVPLLPVPLQALRAWRKSSEGIDLVFPTSTGGMRTDTWRWNDKPERRRDGSLRITEGWKTKAGIRPWLRFHDLRHTCCSHLVMGSWMDPLPIMQVRDWAGHASLSVTERYAHLAPDSIRGAVRRTRGKTEK